MQSHHPVFLLILLAVIGMAMVRYVYWTVDRDLGNLGRAEADPDYRREVLVRLDSRIEEILPGGASLPPLSGPSGPGSRFVPPCLLAVGVALLCGGMFAPEEKGVWYGAGFLAVGASLVYALATLPRRKAERVAGLLRFRADLRRMNGDRAAAVADSLRYLEIAPWDDAGWAELAEDQTESGLYADALRSIREAARLDPRYPEYAAAEASAALLANDPDCASAAVERWEGMVSGGEKTQETLLYRAAVLLRRGDEAAARNVFARAWAMGREAAESVLALDGALAELSAWRGAEPDSDKKKPGGAIFC